MYLPIAGNSVNIFLILGLGGFVGLLSGVFGVGGGFLMTPLLMMFGIPPTVAAASDSNQIVGASTSGTLAHMRLGNVDIPMGLMLLIGGIAGGTVGVQVINSCAPWAMQIFSLPSPMSLCWAVLVAICSGRACKG